MASVKSAETVRRELMDVRFQRGSGCGKMAVVPAQQGFGRSSAKTKARPSFSAMSDYADIADVQSSRTAHRNLPFIQLIIVSATGPIPERQVLEDQRSRADITQEIANLVGSQC